MGIALSTVHTHRSKVFEKLKVPSRTALMLLAVRLGLRVRGAPTRSDPAEYRRERAHEYAGGAVAVKPHSEQCAEPAPFSAWPTSAPSPA
ncbi:MAG: response regulator transcription factor [Flavobacteriales bacterium]|nr:response regulator transcription factor [Flavobacteriales bacterium]